MVDHLRKTSETIILALVVLSPWAFGCIHPFFRYCLTAGICLLLLLWSLELLIAPRRSFMSRFQLPLIALIGIVCLQMVSAKPLADVLSPKAVEWKQQMMPAEVEVLADGQPAVAPIHSARSTVSFYPAETLRRGFWLVLMALVFTRVQDLANSETLRRLCYACLINGSILAYFSVIQHFTSSTGKVFWTFQSMGAAFGPFINRNHFAFYINICFGLSLGLVGSRQMDKLATFDMDGLIEGLKDSLSLWMISVLVFMLGAVILCSSRGGMISLVGSLFITAVFTASTGTFKAGWKWFLMAAGIFALAAGVQVWLGFDFVDSHYADHADNRTALWLPLLKLVPLFPLMGTGLGTLPFVEPWTRNSGAQTDFFLEYAHNEYLQLAVETGLLGFACGFIFLLLLALKIARRIRESRHNSWLYVGLLFSLCSIALHSFTEFGLSIPAIAFLAAVVLGHIAGVGRVKPSEATSIVSKSALRLSAIGIIAFGFFAFQQAKYFDLGERYLLEAQRAHIKGDLENELANYRLAAECTPNDVEFLLEIVRLRFEKFEDETKSDQTALLEAQQTAVTVRELCPMAMDAHLFLSRHGDTFQKSDPAIDYWIRTTKSRPSDPTLAYYTGLAYLDAEDFENATQEFRRSLALDPRHLNDILEKSAHRLTSIQLSEQLLPNASSLVLVQAATWFEQKAKSTKTENSGTIAGDYLSVVEKLRRQALETKEMKLPNSSVLYQRRAVLQLQIGEQEKAIKSYLAALRYDPTNANLAMTSAKLLGAEKRYDEAIRCLKRLRSDNARANKLLRELALLEARGD